MPLVTIPSLAKSYFVHGNIPYPTTSSIANIMSSAAFLAASKLLNTAVTGGTTSGSRGSGSLWTCLGSSDGTTAGIDATNRWTAQNKVIFNSNGSSHSWMLMRNTTIGIDLLLDCNSTGTGNIRAAACWTADGVFSGGSTTAGPTATFEFDARASGGVGAGTNAIFQGDIVTAGTNYLNFICSDDGTFKIFTTRSGFGIFTGVLELHKTTGSDPSDHYAVQLIMDGLNSSRGVYGAGGMTSASACACRSINNVNSTVGGWQTSGTFGGTSEPGTVGTDGGTSNFIAYSIDCYTNSGTPAYRGQMVDNYFIGTAQVGLSFPSAAAQTHVVVGDCLTGWPGVNPLT